MGKTSRKKRFAYVFYATDNNYAVAVCVVVKLLQQIGIRNDIDIVVLHLPIASFIIGTMHKMNIITKKVKKLRYTRDNYYKDCLIKLCIFHLIQYDRVVYLDADSFPLKNLDHLFELPFTEMIAAPRANWLPQPFVTSMLLVVKPSLIMWNRVKKHFETAYENDLCDMDIINLEFKEEMYYLSDEYGCLNSEWENNETPYHFGNPDKNYERIKVVHFTAIGKPWFYHPDKICQLRPNTHPKFLDLWEKWWIARDQIIKESPLTYKLRYSFLKHINQKNKLKWLQNLKTFVSSVIYGNS